MFNSELEKRYEALEARVRNLEWATRIPDPRFDNKISCPPTIMPRWVGFDYFYSYIFWPLLRELGYEIKVQPETLKIEKTSTPTKT